MDEEERIASILEEKGSLSTTEIEQIFTANGDSCPDGAVKHLMRMKAKGIVSGRMDREKKGWVWSLK